MTLRPAALGAYGLRKAPIFGGRAYRRACACGGLVYGRKRLAYGW